MRVAGVDRLLRLRLAYYSFGDPNSCEFRYPPHGFLLKMIHRIIFLRKNLHRFDRLQKLLQQKLKLLFCQEVAKKMSVAVEPQRQKNNAEPRDELGPASRWCG